MFEQQGCEIGAGTRSQAIFDDCSRNQSGSQKVCMVEAKPEPEI